MINRLLSRQGGGEASLWRLSDAAASEVANGSSHSTKLPSRSPIRSRSMKKTPSRVREVDTMRAEYDFTSGIRGKYAKRMPQARMSWCWNRMSPRRFQPRAPSMPRSARCCAPAWRVRAAPRGAAHNRGLLLPGRATASQVAPAAIRDEHQCVCSPLAQQQSPISLESPELYL